MKKKPDKSSEKYWHDKYFSLLNEFEELTQASTEKHELLRRGLVMTTLLAEGQTLSLDRQLSKLRGTLRPGGEGLSDSLVTLREAIDEFEEESIVHIEVLLGLIADTAHKLSQCPLPKPLLSKIKSTQVNSSSELEYWIGYRNQLQAWLEVIGEIAGTEDEQTQKSSWWQNWFGYKAKKDKDSVDITGINTDENVKADIAELIQGVSITVHSLLEKLIIPDHLTSSKLGILERLDSPLDWSELLPVLDDAANFLFLCIESSQLRVQDFLQSLDFRLQDIQTLVTEADTGSNQQSKARTELDILIREQLSNIHTVITDNTDLTALGSRVPEHLEVILRALEHNQDREEQRIKYFKAHTKQLLKRLNEMEQELEKSQQTLKERSSNVTLDPLTGLPKREAFQQRINEELARSRHLGTSLSLVCCDIDSFKRINDSFGYLSGNKALQLVARLLRKNIRDRDFIVRFGGQKFIILMPDTNAKSAVVVAENLRQIIESSPFSFRQKRVVITMSMGIAEIDDKETAMNAYERAEKALQQAKDEGRNKSVLATF